MKKLSKRDRKILLIGSGAVLAILLVVYGILPFYEASSEVSAQVKSQEQLLHRSIQMLQKEDVYRAQLDQVGQLLEHFHGRLLDTRDVSVARVQLEEIVRSLADQNNVAIARSNPLEERKIGERYSRVTLQVNLQGEITEITNFLFALSSHGKFLQVDELNLTSFNVRNEVRLQPRLNVSGFIRLS